VGQSEMWTGTPGNAEVMERAARHEMQRRVRVAG